jgi:hypothetical protein
MCAAADALAAIPGTTTTDRILAVSSDGGENTSGGQCAGPSSAGGPPYDPGSWQQKVSDKLAVTTVTSIRYWGALALRSAPEIDPETQMLRGAGVSDVEFFQDVATGDRFIVKNDGDSELHEPIGRCCSPGEACIVMGAFACTEIGGSYAGDGTTCDAGELDCFVDPLSHDFDVEPDGDVDLFDFAAFMNAFTGPLD